MQQLTLEQFRATVEAGGVLAVTLKAHGAAFALQAETRRGDAVLVDSRRKQPRMFVDPRKAMLLLRNLGIRSATLDADAWRPELADMVKASKPDSSAQLKAAHEAAAYNAWLTGKVESARQGLADGSNARIDPLDWENRRKEKMAAKSA